ncbi:NDP-hexose 2,3-dehydratase family protein [Thermoactinospora rubra]|uniref:NDP-hexose 2,3-dehydratase family protein n=1 Tax=Thermoactinospora rubra TaxID=1088767 RepID=UPI00117E5AC7|nr:NDP-hexose 2,3-dehydratase family protein [Thermoactinospora rubra]
MRVTASAIAGDGLGTLAQAEAWLAERSLMDRATVTRVPLEELDGWETDAATGDIRHRSGKFFVVEGIDVRGPDTAWSQPIINQPEIGILGILVKEFDGVLHCLMQAKNEPGNCNGVQLSPTVQATRSNYTRVHKGKPVPYLEHFLHPDESLVISDVLQSEQGSWFYHKRNRNMVVEAAGPVEPLEGFHWLTIGQLHRLLALPNVVNMDARTVLSCMPCTWPGIVRSAPPAGSPFHAALLRSCSPEYGSLHTTDEVLHWITDVRARQQTTARRIPLNAVRDWRRGADEIAHESGAFFKVIGVEVTTRHREVGHWMQPMIEPCGQELAAFLVAEFGGVLHVLVSAQPGPGYLNVLELGPTVSCIPDDYAKLPSLPRPPFLDAVLDAPAGRVRFDTVLSEEGGRFYHAQTRYMIVELGEDDPVPVPPDYRWMTLHQLAGLLRHSHYVNVQARTLIASLYSLTTERAGVRAEMVGA